MVERRTSKGQMLDFDKLRKSAEAERPAIGNMGTDGKGNKLGKGGQVILSKEERVRAYYRDNPTKVPEKVDAPQQVQADEPAKEEVVEPAKEDVEWVEDADGNFVKKEQ